MSDNFAVGDRVVALVAMSKGVRPGAPGVVTSESTFHGLLTVDFDGLGEVSGIKLHQVAHR